MSKALSNTDDDPPAIRWDSASLWLLGVVAVAALLLCAALAPHSSGGGGYARTHSYVGEDFYSKWSFFEGADPTHGTVKFLTFEEASARGLISAAFDRIYMGTDATEVLGPNEGRKTVRIESNEWFRDGLFVLDLDHAPITCGAWPAFWMFGEDSQHAWPRWGEYDIVEAVHNQTYAATTLHTKANCAQNDIHHNTDFGGQGWVAGSWGTNKAKNCYVQAEGEFPNQGCGQKQPEGSWGKALNEAGGATWVAEWDPDKQHVRTWFFPRGKAPRDLLEKRPVPDNWGMPTSFFSLTGQDCSPDHFRRMRMVFDITFCGDWGNGNFASLCPGAGMSCAEYVQKNPKAFSEAFWSIRVLDVYRRPSERSGVREAPVGTYETLSGASSNLLIPGAVFKTFGYLLAAFGLAGCTAVSYLLHNKATSEDRSFGDAQADGLERFKANLSQMEVPDLSQCTEVDLQALRESEMGTRISQSVAEVGNYFQGAPRPAAIHPQRNLSAQHVQHEAMNTGMVGYRSQPTREGHPGSASASPMTTVVPRQGWMATVTSLWQEPQPASTRQPSLGRNTSSSSGNQICLWPAPATQTGLARVSSPPQSPQGQGQTMRATHATSIGSGGWSNWDWGAQASQYQQPSQGWSLPPTVNALGPGGPGQGPFQSARRRT